MPIRTTRTKTLTCGLSELRVGNLQELLQDVETHARVTVNVSPGDVREPGEVRITVTEEER